MDLERLKTFCGSHGKMATPWTAGEFTYATNGFVLVRVPRIESIPESEGLKVAQFYEAPKPIDGWVDLPGDLGSLTECPDCHGGNDGDCPECDGDGDIEFQNSHNTYVCECKTCDGTGEGNNCKGCRGTGTTDSKPETKIDGVLFGTAFLRLFSDLKGCQIAPHSGRIAWLQFEGGDGFVMPRTPARED